MLSSGPRRSPASPLYTARVPSHSNACLGFRLQSLSLTSGAVRLVDMGDGRVAFGHDGFNDRMRQYPFPFSSAAENVAMCQNYADPAKVPTHAHARVNTTREQRSSDANETIPTDDRRRVDQESRTQPEPVGRQ